MPVQARDGESPGPDQPHLALLIDEAGMRLAIPPGASLWLVEDKSDQSKIFPLVLKKVSHKMLVFEMLGKDGAVTEYRYQLTTAKPMNRAALKQVANNNPNAKAQR